MIKFLLKGIWNDKSRSLLPIIVVCIGATLTVLISCWLRGVMGESLVMNANFSTGHVKVTTKAYAEELEQAPNDLAIIGVDKLLVELKTANPEMDWVKRIRFGGMIDFPDDQGETRAQGPVAGWAIDLFTKDAKESQRFNIQESLVSGKLPSQPGEALITNDFAVKFNVKPGDDFTLFGSTMDGSMAFRNFKVAGTVRFGSNVLDRGSLIIDITDAEKAFAMDDAAGEILGFFDNSTYNNEKATLVTNSFNEQYKTDTDEFSPVMLRLRDQGSMAEYIDFSTRMGSIMVSVFVLAMSVVLWNTGLLGGLRRYNEFGVRLALGEEKNHIYKTLIYEGILIGGIGSIIGTSIGLGISYYLQEVGVDLSGSMKNSSLMMPSVVRASICPAAFYVGFIPGIFSMVLGNALAGIGIYKRKTAQLFKELE